MPVCQESASFTGTYGCDTGGVNSACTGRCLLLVTWAHTHRPDISCRMCAGAWLPFHSWSSGEYTLSSECGVNVWGILMVGCFMGLRQGKTRLGAC